MRPAHTPDRVTSLEPQQIFVFGSNYAGRHGKGAALTAMHKFGARSGVGMGLSGQSYGIATKDRNLNVLSLVAIQVQVDRFIRFAEAHPELDFLVTRIGCGLARLPVPQMAKMFTGALRLPNVILPLDFLRHIRPVAAAPVRR
jgi:hypothetical protein